MDILESVKKHTEYNRGKSQEIAKLFYEDTSYSEIDFAGYDINYGKFLSNIFNMCDFTNVYMSGAWFCGSSFNDCIFNNNIFRKGNADYTYFVKTDLNYFDGFRSSFYEARFENMKIDKSELKNCHFGRAIFKNLIFKDTDLSGANFTNSEFINVKFISCYFSNTIFKDVKGWERMDFQEASIQVAGEIIQGTEDEIKQYLGGI